MKSFAKFFAPATLALLLLACNAPDKQLIQNLETGATGFKAMQPSVDSVVGQVKGFIEKYNSIPPEVKGTDTSPIAQFGQMTESVSNKIVHFEEQYKQGVNEYDFLLEAYKLGKIEKDSVVIRLQALAESQHDLTKTMIKIKSGLPQVEEQLERLLKGEPVKM